MAKAVGKRKLTEVEWADTYVQPEDWAEADMTMPLESKPQDCGWKPGPIERELPEFKGPKPGPTDTSFNSDTTPEQIMATQLTPEFKAKWVEYTLAHCKAYRAAKANWIAKWCGGARA